MSHLPNNYYSNKTPPYPVTPSDLDSTVNFVNSEASSLRAVQRGGTNIGTYSVGDILYATAASVLSKLSAGASTDFLKGGTAPSWAALNQAAIAGLTASDAPTWAGATLEGTLEVDTITEDVTDAGVTIETILLKDGDVTMPDGKQIKVDVINDKAGSGTVIEGVTILNGAMTLAGDIAMASNSVTGLAAITSATIGTAAATKDYVDSLAQGLEWQDSVLTFQASLPGSPSEGQRFILSGTWGGGSINDIATYLNNDWVLTEPNEGFTCWVEDEDVNYTFTTSWVTMGSTVSHDNTIGGTAILAHGVAVEIVGTTDAQTLTNKQLTTPGLNEATGLTSTSTELNQLDGVSVGGTSAGDIATINATQTLTNKTLTSPSINSPGLNEAVALSATSTELNQLDGVAIPGTDPGDVVTIDATQTLTSKRLTSPKINSSTALSATSVELNQLDGVSIPGTDPGDVVTIDASQTLTNKSISGGQINSGVVAENYLPNASDTAQGVLKVNDSTTLTSSVIAASSTAVKTTKIVADAAKILGDAAMPKAGGAFTGPLTTNSTINGWFPDYVDRRWWIGPRDCYFDNISGTVNYGASFAPYAILPSNGFAFSHLHFSTTIPWTKDTNDVIIEVYYGYHVSEDTQFRMELDLGSGNPVISPMAWNVANPALSSVLVTGSSSNIVYSTQISVTDSDIGKGKFLWGRLKIGDGTYPLSPSIRFYGIRVMFIVSV